MPGDVVRYGMISTARIGLDAHLPAALKSNYSAASSGGTVLFEEV